MHHRTVFWREFRRIVVLGRAGLGDTVYMIPALKTIRKRFPQAHITVIVGQRGYPLLQRCPYVDTINLRYLENGAWGKLREIVRLWRGQYDLAVILDTSREKALRTFLARIPVRVGGVKGMLTRLLTHPVSIPPDAHQINDLYRLVVEAIGCDVSEWRFELFPRLEAYQSAQEKLREAGWHNERPLIGINPGASAPNKQWLPERFAMVADELIKQGAQVVVLGAPSDAAQVEAMVKQMHYSPLFLSGKLDLDELIICLSELDLLVSGDTGPSHLAAAVGTPVVAIFGPSRAEHYAPLGAPHIVIDRSHLCSPTCSFWTCRGNNRACMRSVYPHEVCEAVQALLQSRKVNLSIHKRNKQDLEINSYQVYND